MMQTSMKLAVAVVLLALSGATPEVAPLGVPPECSPVVMSVRPPAPGEDAVAFLVEFSATDLDGDFFGFMPTSGLSDPSAGTLLSSCVCVGTYAGEICSCTTFFVPSETFTGSVTFTYVAVDTEGNVSEPCTVTINSTVTAQTPEQILNDIIFIIRRGVLPGGDIDATLEQPLMAKVNAIFASLAAGNISAALGETGALCNQFDAGIKASNIRDVAAQELPPQCERLDFSITTLQPRCNNNIHDLNWNLTVPKTWRVDLNPDTIDGGDDEKDESTGEVSGLFRFSDLAKHHAISSTTTMEGFIGTVVKVTTETTMTTEVIQVPFGKNTHPDSGAHADHETVVDLKKGTTATAKELARRINKRRMGPKVQSLDVPVSPTTQLLRVLFVGNITTKCPRAPDAFDEITIERTIFSVEGERDGRKIDGGIDLSGDPKLGSTDPLDKKQDDEDTRASAEDPDEG